MVKLRLYSLGKDFRVIREEMFQNASDARLVAERHAKENGFTSVRFVNDEDYTERVTATTPNGRAGRNVAVIEFGYEDE